MKISEAAAELEVSASTVRRLLDSGDLGYDLVGKRCIRISHASIDAYGRQQLEASCQSKKIRQARAVTSSNLSTAGAAFIAAARKARAKPKRKRSR